MTEQNMAYKIWIKERFELFQKIFKDFQTSLYKYGDDVCFEIILDTNLFRLWVIKEEYIKNTLGQRNELWLIRLEDMKRDIEDCIESLNNVTKAIERNQK